MIPPGCGPSRPTRHPTMLRLVAALLLTIMGSAQELRAQTQPPVTNAAPTAAADRSGFALVLGGGGARGLAHVGVLSALEELGVVPSFVAGTSMGAIIGSMYAAGHRAAAIDSLLHDRNWLQTLLDEAPPPLEVQGGWHASLPDHLVRFQLDRWRISPPTGASYGQSVETLVGRMTADALFVAERDFDRLPIPFRCVATDLMSGEAVIPSHGVLARLVRASGGLPLVFVPIAYEGRLLLDGGLVDNLPLRVARAQGYARAVVVDVSNVLLPADDPPADLFALAERAAQLAQVHQNSVELGPGDLLLRIDLRRYNLLSFWAARDIVRAGYDAAMEQADALRAMALDTNSPASRPPCPQLGPVEVAEVVVHGNLRLSAWSIRKRFDLRAGDRVELGELWVRAEALARQSVFDNAWVDVAPLADGRARVHLHVKERDRPELEAAAHYRDGEGPALLLRLRLDNRLGAGSAHTLSWRLGDEHSGLRADTTVPVRASRRAELRMWGGWRRERAEIFDEGDRIDAWSLTSAFGGADHALAFPRREVVLLLGVEVGDTRRRLESGTSRGRSQWRALHAGLETWTGGGLNAWPRQGFAVHAHWGLDVLGGEVSAWKIEGGFVRRMNLPGRWGQSLGGGGAWGASDLPVELWSRAGGPRGWVGRHPDEILAPRLVWGRWGVDFALGREWRIEAALAHGWHGVRSLDEHRPRPGVQLQTVWDSAIGPVHLGWATLAGRGDMVFLDVGHDF